MAGDGFERFEQSAERDVLEEEGRRPVAARTA
jgi:hypothetical protein